MTLLPPRTAGAGAAHLHPSRTQQAQTPTFAGCRARSALDFPSRPSSRPPNGSKHYTLWQLLLHQDYNRTLQLSIAQVDSMSLFAEEKGVIPVPFMRRFAGTLAWPTFVRVLTVMRDPLLASDRRAGVLFPGAVATGSAVPHQPGSSINVRDRIPDHGRLREGDPSSYIPRATKSHHSGPSPG